MNLARLCARLKPVFLSKKGPSKARLLTKMSPSEELGTLVFVFITGLGDTVDSDRETVEQLVNKLKEEIKHVNAFVILFNGQVLATVKFVFIFFWPESEVHSWFEKHDQAL